MSTTVLVLGQSGSGKSTSISFLPEKETFLINVQGKSLPFKSWKNKYIKAEMGSDGKILNASEFNMVNNDKFEDVVRYINAFSKSDRFKYCVIDDCQYLMANEFMRRRSDKAKDATFQKFNDIGGGMWDVINAANKIESDGKIVFFMWHPDTDDFGREKAKTIGRLLDDKVCVEGMFPVVLKCHKDENGSHWFNTKGGVSDSVKSPIGMFSEDKIDNNLKMVAEAIEEYNK